LNLIQFRFLNVGFHISFIICPAIFGASMTLLNTNHYDVYFKGMPHHYGKTLRGHGDELSKLQEDIIKHMVVQMAQ